MSYGTASLHDNDGLDRLVSASCTSWSHTYTYDKAGDKTGKDSITYTINSVNEVTTLSNGTTFSYDDNGNRIQKTNGDDTWDYMYDYVNRLTKVEENDSTIGEYVYDGDGKRLQKTENSITTTYIYSGINPVFEENSTGSACYAYGPTGLIAKRTTIDQESNTYFYHKDHLGSIRSVTDSSKTIIASSTYHPFGETEMKEGSEPYLFNGKERDTTGLYYYGARYYDSQIGRFLTRDNIRGKLAISQSLNRYSYCINNPLKYIDPKGLCFAFADEEAMEQSSGTETEQINAHDSETGKYFENPDGEGFIYLESDIIKNGNVGVALGTNHIPMSANDPDHGLVIFIYDENDKIVDTKFISLSLLVGEDSPKLKELINELDEKGLKDNFKKAIDGLEDYCDKRSSSIGTKSFFIGIFSGLITWGGASLLGLGAMATPLAIIAGIAIPIILYLGDSYWDTNEDTVDDIENEL